MKNQFVTISILAFAMTIMLFSSCAKEEDVKTAKDNLTEGNWVITNLTINPGMDMGDGYPVTDVYPYLEDCQRDDIMDYETDGTVIMHAGATKCDPNDPETMDLGKWELSNNNATLTITDPVGELFSGTIQTLNATTFIWTYQIEDLDGDGNTLIYNYTMGMKSQ